MKNKVTKYIVLGSTLLFALQFTGCGWTTKDAEQYTTALLQVVSTGENKTDTKFSDLSEDEYAEAHQTVLNNLVESADVKYVYDVNEDTEQSYIELLDRALQNINYEVGTAVKSEDGFEVPVTFYPLDLFGSVDTVALCDEVMDQLETAEIVQDDVYDAFMKKVFQDATGKLDEPSFGDAKTVNVNIKKDEDGIYSADDSVADLGEAFFVDIYPADDAIYAAINENGYNARMSEIYMHGMMDLLKYGENTTGMRFDDLSNDEFANYHDEIINEFTNAIFAGEEVSKEVAKGYKDFFGTIISKISYEIGDAVEEENGYTIPIKMKPLYLIGDSIDIDKIYEEVADEYLTGKVTDDQLMNAIFGKLLKELNKYKDNPQYGEEETVYVDLTYEDGHYSISEETGELLGTHLFVLE